VDNTIAHNPIYIMCRTFIRRENEDSKDHTINTFWSRVKEQVLKGLNAI
jgi:hypothetical protein